MTKKEIIDRLNYLRSQELFAIQQYMNHYYMVKGMDYADVKDIERSIAITEMRHAEALAEKINMLGGNPISHPGEIAEMRGSKITVGNTTEEMIKADLNLERAAIREYTKAIIDIGDTDPGIRKLLQDILADEEDHADSYSTWLGEDVAYELEGFKEAA